MTPLVLRPPEQTDQVAIGPKDTVDMEAVRTRGDNRGDSRNVEVHVHERGLELADRRIKRLRLLWNEVAHDSVSSLLRIAFRSEEGRVGKECVSTCRSRG